MDEHDYLRLHITPLTPEILTILLSTSLRQNARNISYHSIPTFPENNYGFVELPREDADKMRKKFKGCIIRGRKVLIEIARPLRHELAVVQNISSSSLSPVKVKKSEILHPSISSSILQRVWPDRRKKRQWDEYLAVDIGDRHVKRGWTTPIHELKKRDSHNKHTSTSQARVPVKSKYTSGPECLFKTILPKSFITTNAQSNQIVTDKRKRSTNRILIHEFANTNKFATFLKSTINCNNSGISSFTSKNNSSALVSKFVEGTGWFDEEDNLVEKATPRRSKNLIRDTGHSSDMRQRRKDKNKNTEQTRAESAFELDKPFKKDSHLDVIKERLEMKALDSELSLSRLKCKDVISNNLKSIYPLRSPSSSLSNKSSKKGGESEFAEKEQDIHTNQGNQTFSNISNFPKNSSVTETPDRNTSTSNSTHPLALLYKTCGSPRSKLSFKFFSSETEKKGDNEDEAQVLSQNHIQNQLIPLVTQGNEHLIPRSAASTYDRVDKSKCHDSPYKIDDNFSEERENPARMSNKSSEQCLSECDKVSARARSTKNNADLKLTAVTNSSSLSLTLVEESSVSVTSGIEENEKQQGQQKQNDEFQKWFWTNQGQINRSWKKRRKTVLKEHRQRENSKRKFFI